MDATGKIKVGEAAKVADGPGRTPKQAARRWRNLVAMGVIPSDGEAWGSGGTANLFPQWAGAVGAVLFDLMDAGIVGGKKDLASLWQYFSEVESDGEAPLITHVLAEIASGGQCWLIMTLWRHRITGKIVPTCATRFADEIERPLESPSPDHDPVADYVIRLHELLARFANTESNIVPLGKAAS